MRPAARREFDCVDSDTVFGFVGSGFARKGLAAAIAALAATGRQDLRLLVAGTDTAQAKFSAQARRAGIGDRVAFLGGLEDVRSIYAASDCFILPTRYDPFPNAALEALAMGLPAIVSDQCGAAELIRPGLNGWVCKADSIAPLADLMVEAASAAGGPMEGVARHTAENFGIDKMADRMSALYAELLGRPKDVQIGS